MTEDKEKIKELEEKIEKLENEIASIKDYIDMQEGYSKDFPSASEVFDWSFVFSISLDSGVTSFSSAP